MTILLIVSPHSFADQISDFYKQRIITIHVGFERDSSYDQYSRALARHLSRHIPGNPAIRVENSPNGGRLRLANLVYNFLPQDGTVIANIAPSTAIEPLLGNKNAKFDASWFNWLGSMNKEVTVCAVWQSAPVMFWQDLIDQQTVMGGSSAEFLSHQTPILLNNLFGTRIRLITAYPDDSSLNTAIERGDLDGRCGWLWSDISSHKTKWVKDKKVRILLQTSLTKHPDLPNISLITDFAKTRRDLQILKFTYASQIWGRPYIVGPRVPKARVAALRHAFEKTMTDKRFLHDARQEKLNVAWVDGVSVQMDIADLYALPDEVIAAAVKATTNRANTAISRAVIPIKSSLGKITKLQADGHRLSWAGEGIKGAILLTNKRTKITINGKREEIGALKAGMNCKFTYRARSAKRIICE